MNFKKLFRFSLRRFLIGIALVAIVVGWYGRRAHHQRLAVSKVTAGRCTYDFELKPRVEFSLFPNDNSPLADSIRNAVGKDLFGSVVKVEIDETFASEEQAEHQDISYLAYFSNLESLEAVVRCVNDDGMVIFKNTPKLKTLMIYPKVILMQDKAKIPTDWFTEKSFEILYGLSELESLKIVIEDCSDESILRFASLKNLKEFHFYRSPAGHDKPDETLIKQFLEKMPQMNVKDIVIY